MHAFLLLLQPENRLLLLLVALLVGAALSFAYLHWHKRKQHGLLEIAKEALAAEIEHLKKTLESVRAAATPKGEGDLLDHRPRKETNVLLSAATEHLAAAAANQKAKQILHGLLSHLPGIDSSIAFAERLAPDLPGLHETHGILRAVASGLRELETKPVPSEPPSAAEPPAT